jgi:hypothetical protein
MALYNPDHVVDVRPEQAVVAVRAFLIRCRKWAIDREIPKRAARVSAGADAMEAAKLHAWVAMVGFVDHAIQELESGKIDHWFITDAPRSGDGTP